MPVTDDQLYGRDALNKGEPWIVPEALEFLLTVLQPHWNVFEWGCGGSTVFFSKRCASLVGIEHNPEWIERVTQMMQRQQCPANWTMRYVQGHGIDHMTAFREYANVILEYEDASFDLVSVDGEASCRGWCIDNALPKLKAGGYLLLDNSDWFKGDLGWQRWDFVAKDMHYIGQPVYDWWTSILRKPLEVVP